MTTTVDASAKPSVFSQISLRRKLTNNLASILVTLSVVVAIVPLVWVLVSVVT
jgi:phosphate transport system permease protein